MLINAKRLSGCVRRPALQQNRLGVYRVFIFLWLGGGVAAITLKNPGVGIVSDVELHILHNAIADFFVFDGEAGFYAMEHIA